MGHQVFLVCSFGATIFCESFILLFLILLLDHLVDLERILALKQLLQDSGLEAAVQSLALGASLSIGQV